MAIVSTTALEKVRLSRYNLNNSTIQQALDENTLLKLISSIDDLIDDKGLEIMKLSMQGELTQTERDSANSPSDLLHSLKEKYITPTVLYARIIYTLEIVGHKFYGYRAVRKMEKVYTPPHFDVATQLHSTNTDEFFLYQCLAVACRLIPENSWDSFIFHCAEMLNHNRGRYTTPCQVLAKMLQEGVLNTENYRDTVEEALIKAGVSESVLHKYHKSCTKITSKHGPSSLLNISFSLHVQ